jgi:hypothetical protein
MDLYTALRNVLIGNGAVSALVGSGSAARVYRGWQQGYTTPAIIVQDDGQTPQNDLSGHSGFTVGSLVVTCRDATSTGADAIKAAVVPVLAGYAGTFDLVIDSVVSSTTAKEDGSNDHWFDWAIDLTSFVSEAI